MGASRFSALLCRLFGCDVDWVQVPEEELERAREEIRRCEEAWSKKIGKPIGVGKPAPCPPMPLHVTLRCKRCGR